MRLAIVTLACAALFGGCIKNEEEIVVLQDGGIEVRMTAKGGGEDLTSGYPLAFGGPWRPANDLALAWTLQIGPDTGSAATARQWAALATDEFRGDDVELASQARFASAAEMPRFLAPDSEPYRSAFLERTTRLDVLDKGTRRVYVFERTFGARHWRDRQVLANLEDDLPADIAERVSASEPLSDEQWQRVTPIVVDDYEKSALAFAGEALCSNYRDGDASLPTAALAVTLREVSSQVRARIDERKLRDVYALLTQPDGEESADDPVVNPDLILRDCVRGALRSSLAAQRVPEATQFSILERLEHAFTAFDASVDLQDEEFNVAVAMPGTIVEGNYDELEGTRATWSFKGEDLNDRAVVLRVVSVLE